MCHTDVPVAKHWWCRDKHFFYYDLEKHWWCHDWHFIFLVLINLIYIHQNPILLFKDVLGSVMMGACALLELAESSSRSGLREASSKSSVLSHSVTMVVSSWLLGISSWYKLLSSSNSELQWLVVGQFESSQWEAGCCSWSGLESKSEKPRGYNVSAFQSCSLTLSNAAQICNSS